MARPLRMEFPGACYHVICRGNFRFPVFREDRDRELILRRLVDFSERFLVRIRSYCVMVNHLHVYARTEEANLGRFMQSFLTSFTVSYNRRHHTSGHVFQGRYKAFLVQDDSSYRDEVTRYIHLNPGCIPSLMDAPIDARQRVIREYRWSSYGAAIGLRRCPRWLDRQAVLHGFPGARLRERQQTYARFVEQGLTAELWDPRAAAVAQTVIGNDSFVDRVRRAVASVSDKASVRRECGQQEKLLAWCGLRDVVLAVSEGYGLAPAELLRRWSRNNEARQVLLYLAVERCRGRYSATELAHRLGRISISGLGKAHDRVETRMERDPALRERVRHVQQRLGTESKA